MATLSANSSVPVQPGQCVVDTGGDIWLPYSQSGTLFGQRIAVAGKLAMPGGALVTILTGEVPYSLYNLGAGNPGPVIAGTTPSRASTTSGGNTIGYCDGSGAITLVPAYLGTPAQGSAKSISSVAGVPASTSLPVDGQSQVYQASSGQMVWSAAGSGSQGGTAGVVAIVNAANANLNIGVNTIVGLTGGGTAAYISGLTNGVSGRRVTIVNFTGSPIYFTYADAGSLAANRLNTLNSATTFIGAGGSTEFVYGSLAGVPGWFQVDTTQAAGFGSARAFLAVTVAPASLTAPSGARVAAALFTPIASKTFAFSFTLTGTPSASDSFVLEVAATTGVTSVSGGTSSGGLLYAGPPIVITGGAAQPDSSRSVSPTGTLEIAATASGACTLPAGLSTLSVYVTSNGGKNYSGLNLSGFIYELP